MAIQVSGKKMDYLGAGGGGGVRGQNSLFFPEEGVTPLALLERPRKGQALTSAGIKTGGNWTGYNL